MKKLKVKILGLSYSKSQIGSYILIISDEEEYRKVPIIIKPSEAHKIAIEIEGIDSNRPMIYDSIKSLTDSFDIEPIEINIESIKEGIFNTNLVLKKSKKLKKINMTIADSIIMSIVYNCPIYIEESLLESVGIITGDNIKDTERSKKSRTYSKEENRIISIEDLELMMSEAIINEEYEIAAEIRDKINELKAARN